MRGFSFISRAGLPWLAIVSTGLFSTAAQAQDVALIAVIKAQSYTQSNPETPWLSDSDAAIFFNIFVATAGPGSVNSASLLGPVGAAQPLEVYEDGVEFEREFEKKPELDQAFPAGDYQLTLNTVNDGPKVVTVTMTPDNYPSIPRVVNYDDAQSINATNEFTLTWDPFAGGTVNDYIRMEIRERFEFGGDDAVYESPFPGEPGALDGTDTSLVLPANTLQPGKRYEAWLFFGRVADVDFSYGLGVAAYALQVRETDFSMVTIGGSDTESPSLEESRPGSFSGFVDRNAVVAFEFDEPMNTLLDPAGSVVWTGLDGSSVEYLWSEDGRTLFCVPADLMTGGTTITWSLNPNGSPMQLQDLAGNPLGAGANGQFDTSQSDPETGTDVRELLVLKGVSLCQTSAEGSEQSGAFLSLEVGLLGLNRVLSGELLLPGGGVVAMTPANEGRELGVEADYVDLPDLTTFFPDGTYTLTTEGVDDGVHSVELDLTGALYPPDPTVLNFAAAQEIDPALPFTLLWNVFTNGTPDDPVFVEIEDESGLTVAGSPEYGSPSALNGSGPSQFEIPANTLYPGRTYEVELTWARVADENDTDYPGVTALAAYLKVLEFEITTAGTPLQPVLVLDQVSGGSADLTLTGEPNRAYAIDVSVDATTWHSLGFQTAWDGTFYFSDQQAWNHSQRFYRAREISGDQAVIVYGRVVNNMNSSSVAGAVVSTSLDSQTAVSDANGYFTLVTRSESESYELVYEIRVEAEGFQPWAQTDSWGRTPWQELRLQPAP